MGHAAAVRGALSGGRAGAGAIRFLGRNRGASGFFFAAVGGGAAAASSTGGVGAGGGGGASRAVGPGRCRLRLTRGLAPAGGFARGLAAAGAGADPGAAACVFGRSALQMAQQRNCASASLWT